MARNRFEQVDEKQDDAITLSLWKVGDSMYGTVTIPSALSGGKLPGLGESLRRDAGWSRQEGPG